MTTMKRALITGGAGFIGVHLARKLIAEGYVVDLVDNFSRGVRDAELEGLLSSGQATLIPCDMLDSAAVLSLLPPVARYEVIFHFAAIIGVANVLNRPYAVLRDNTMMLANIIEAAKQHPGLRRFLFTSTSEVYAGTLQHFELPVPTPESTPLAITSLDHPRTSYMLSKIYGEAMLQQAGLPFTIIRPHNFYGPRMGMSHVVPELLKKAYVAPEGGQLHVASAHHMRAFCYIEDAVEMTFRAATVEACLGKTLNIGNQDVELSIGELARTIIAVVGRNLEVVAGPETAGSPSRRCPEMTLTTGLTGYRARVGLEEGVRRTFDWYRREVFDGEGVSAT